MRVLQSEYVLSYVIKNVGRSGQNIDPKPYHVGANDKRLAGADLGIL